SASYLRPGRAAAVLLPSLHSPPSRSAPTSLRLPSSCTPAAPPDTPPPAADTRPLLSALPAFLPPSAPSAPHTIPLPLPLLRQLLADTSPTGSLSCSTPHSSTLPHRSAPPPPLRAARPQPQTLPSHTSLATPLLPPLRRPRSTHTTSPALPTRSLSSTPPPAAHSRH